MPNLQFRIYENKFQTRIFFVREYVGLDIKIVRHKLVDNFSPTLFYQISNYSVHYVAIETINEISTTVKYVPGLEFKFCIHFVRER